MQNLDNGSCTTVTYLIASPQDVLNTMLRCIRNRRPAVYWDDLNQTIPQGGLQRLSFGPELIGCQGPRTADLCVLHGARTGT